MIVIEHEQSGRVICTTRKGVAATVVHVEIEADTLRINV